MRVLQVEDDEATARAVAQTLAAKGFTCDTVSLGEEAIELASQSTYDLILLDIMLPDIDGYEVLRRLRDADINTPVVIQTGTIGQPDSDLTKGFGVREELIKPFSGSDLRECVASILERAASPELGHVVPEPEDGKTPRRRHKRVKTLKSAQIIFKNSNCVSDCFVINMSLGGAALKISEKLEVPETFLLKLQNGPMYRCHVCWRHVDKIGVMFIEQPVRN